MCRERVLPDDVPYELYCSVRTAYNDMTNEFDPWFIGAVGFLASYNGRFFDGGYAKPGYDNGRLRNYYVEHRDNLLSQDLSGIDFSVCDYSAYVGVSGAVIYCDPPYAGTKKYNSKIQFNTDEFFDFARDLSKDNIVLISEHAAPNDFITVWEHTVKRCINAADKFSATEKMFIHKGRVDDSEHGNSENKQYTLF